MRGSILSTVGKLAFLLSLGGVALAGKATAQSPPADIPAPTTSGSVPLIPADPQPAIGTVPPAEPTAAGVRPPISPAAPGPSPERRKLFQGRLRGRLRALLHLGGHP